MDSSDQSNTGSHRAVDPSAPGAKREPRQERGQRRVEEILDAAEALVQEVGAAATSVQEIAKRSGASVGSIYHFFPTKEAIFDALRERHRVEARLVAEGIRQNAPQWATQDLATFVRGLVGPFTELLSRMPAYPELAVNAAGHRLPRDETTDASVREAILVAFTLRWPHTTPEERAIRADVMDAIGEGLGSLLCQTPHAQQRAVMDEFGRAIYGYLWTHEPQP
ncbi:MAG TPA: TetR/AcrR family transcriptional regulator [Gemmatimonas sp.]|uniref:TetR/AcrR family transcriptional regulator n=1 Tax=Gemmatimonas sp. TaxID=1962908 RepID=UPI002ED96D28